MSYESAVVIFIVFLIPTTIFVITRVIRLRREEKAEQADMALMFSSKKDNSGKISF